MVIESVDLKALIDGCKKGNRSCQQKIYELFYKKMMAVSLRYAGNHDDAKDVLHESFIKVFTSIKNYQDTGSFEGWVRRIVVNTSIDLIRRAANSKIITSSDYIQSFGEDVADEMDWFTENEISPEIILDEIKKLSPAYRTVFNMYVVEGYSHKEIADHLGITEGTSKSNLAKAKINLRKTLRPLIEKTN